MDDDMILYIAWGVAAAVLTLAAAKNGPKATRPWNLVLSKGTSRVSLANLQLTLWTIVVLSMFVGVFVARLLADGGGDLIPNIPENVLAVMGISLGSNVAAGMSRRKSTSDIAPSALDSSNPEAKPRLLQAITTTGNPDDPADIGRFQNFVFTIVAVAAYVALAVDYFSGASEENLTSLPDFSSSLNWLLLISHGGYLTKKVVDNQPDANGSGGSRTPPPTGS